MAFGAYELPTCSEQGAWTRPGKEVCVCLTRGLLTACKQTTKFLPSNSLLVRPVLMMKSLVVT